MLREMVVASFLAGATAFVGCGESTEDIIDDFVADSGHDYADCGSGPACGAIGTCLVSAFTSCSPSRADLGDGTYFVLPDSETGGCHVFWFTTGVDGTFEKHECLSLGNTGTGCADRESCDIRNRWHL